MEAANELVEIDDWEYPLYLTRDSDIRPVRVISIQCRTTYFLPVLVFLGETGAFATHGRYLGSYRSAAFIDGSVTYLMYLINGSAETNTDSSSPESDFFSFSRLHDYQP